MKDRIVRIINEVGMNTTQFAEALGVQASTVQHIRSERNKPSLDVIQRLLKRFRWVNPNWLLFGEGEMRLDVTSDNLFTPDEVRSAADAETTPRKQQSSSSPAHPKQTPPVQPKQTPPPPVQPLQKHRTPTVVKSQTASTHIDPTAASDSSAPTPPPPTTPTHTTSTTASQALDNPAPYPTPYICNTTKERKIDRILLLYSDSTFETFLQNVHL